MTKEEIKYAGARLKSMYLIMTKPNPDGPINYNDRDKIGVEMTKVGIDMFTEALIDLKRIANAVEFEAQSKGYVP